MTIKEIEERSGLSRANIRFYENEGLIDPKRNSNGYRDYSEKDLDELLRIKLLRSLDFSIEEIKNLRSGQKTLSDAVQLRLRAIESEKRRLDRAGDVCRSMLTDRASYASLNTAKYFRELSRGPEPVAVPKKDIPPRVTSPWKRFFARTFDLTLYTVIVDLVFVYVFLLSPFDLAESAWSTISSIIALVLMAVIEPVLLCTWGTTPGKWIFGLRVTGTEGYKLTWNEAHERTWLVLWHGMGLTVPVYYWIRLWRSYQNCFEDDLVWEHITMLELKDEKKWRNFAFVCAELLLSLMFVLLLLLSSAPKHRGDLTKAEFIENYNRYVSYYDYSQKLDENGKWQGTTPEPGVIVVDITTGVFPEETPPLEISEENGIVTKVSFSFHSVGSKTWQSAYTDTVACAVYSLARSGEGYFPIGDKTEELLDNISRESFTDFSAELYGYSISGDYEYSGYISTAGMLYPIENADKEYSFNFTIEKIQ